MMVPDYYSAVVVSPSSLHQAEHGPVEKVIIMPALASAAAMATLVAVVFRGSRSGFLCTRSSRSNSCNGGCGCFAAAVRCRWCTRNTIITTAVVIVTVTVIAMNRRCCRFIVDVVVAAMGDRDAAAANDAPFLLVVRGKRRGHSFV